MGPTKQTATTNATTTSAPYAPTQPLLQSIIDASNGQIPNYTPTPTENAAFTGLTANANAGNPYAGPIGDLTSTLLGGGNGIQDYINSQQPYANMNTNPYENVAFKNLIDTQTNDITKQIKSMYAGAGYSPTSSGDFSYNLGRGISAGTAPTAANAEEYLTNLRSQAAGNILGAQQQGLSNQLQGAQLAPAALAARDSPYTQLLNIGQMQRGLPLQNLGSLESLIVPMAQLGGTSNQNGTTQSYTQVPPLQQLTGGLIGGLGLAGATGGFGPSGWLYGSGYTNPVTGNLTPGNGLFNGLFNFKG